MESWPSILPDPLRSGYRYQPDACVLRTQMDGKRRVRKLFTRQPYSFDITVRLSDTQLAIFDYFWQKKLDSGSKWFELPLSTGKGKETVTARFLIEPDINADGRYWRVSGSVEVEEIPLYSESEYNDAIMQ